VEMARSGFHVSTNDDSYRRPEPDHA
jgi:hypothetical protein